HAARKNCPTASLGPLPAKLCRQFIYDTKPHIVPCLFILSAWIAQTNNQFHAALLTTISQTCRQVLRQTSLDDLLLCLLEGIGNAIEGEAVLRVVDHKCCTGVSVAWLTNTARVNNSTVVLRCLPISFGWNNHFIGRLNHTLAQ